MTVNYYKIKGCKLDGKDDKVFIVAPKGADEELLKAEKFEKSEDDETKWIHYLTELELVQIKSCFSDTVNFKTRTEEDEHISEAEKRATNLSVIGVFLIALTPIVPSKAAFWMAIAAYIDAVWIRIFHKKNKAGVVLSVLCLLRILVQLILLGVGMKSVVDRM